MIAGPNGSGKSTLIELLRHAGVDFGIYLNADDIARQMAGDPASVAQAAQAELRRRRNEAQLARRDYSWETVMSHPSHIEHLAAARAAGYETRLVYVAVDDPDVNVARVAHRVARGGHDVPSDRVAARHARSLALIPEVLAISSHARLFDNGSREEPFRLLLTKDGGSVSLRDAADAWPSWFRRLVITLRASAAIKH